MQQKKVLVLNAGSSNLKASLFSTTDADPSFLDEQPIWQREIEWGTKDRCDETTALLRSIYSGSEQAVADSKEIAAIGHRIVHGGTAYTTTTVITDTVLSNLRKIKELAPQHEAVNIMGIEIASQIFEGVPQIAVFDTSFHCSMPAKAVVYPCPYHWYEQLGIRRFGFHGINHQYSASRAAQLLKLDLSSLRIITCHLGSGASLCAIKNGQSQMTTMGYTPLEGLVMGTRCGSIDPGIILHLLNNNNYSASELTDILNKEAGLQGISGVSADMRAIEDRARSGHQRAQLAFDIYVDRLAAMISSLVPALGGLDTLVFTGGVGQNSSNVRAVASSKLQFLGVKLNPKKNECATTDVDISLDQAAVRTFVIQAREDLAIGRECLPFLRIDS